jgi:hypothetical protein
MSPRSAVTIFSGGYGFGLAEDSRDDDNAHEPQQGRTARDEQF